MLERFFHPRSVAVVGASTHEAKVGHSVLRNLVEHGFPGPIYPVNPKADEILGLPCYRDVSQIPGPVDLSVLVIPPKIIPGLLGPLREKDNQAAIVISAGFKESGYEGEQLEKDLVTRAGELDMRIMGPNCLGLISTPSRLNASFAAGMPPPGKIGFFSQSGALCTAILDWALGNDVGFSHFISLGNKADLNELDFIRALAEDENTRVILGYLEGIERGREFMEIASKVTKQKPIIIVKSGSSQAGARAASSHTGTLAGSDRAYDAAFAQSGVIRAETIEEVFHLAVAFAEQPLPETEPGREPRLAVITNAGGPGIITADACERYGVQLSSFEPETVEKLKAALPPHAAFYNPVDIIGDARADRYRAALDAITADVHVNGLLVLLTPQAMTEEEATAEAIGEVAKTSGKTFLASFMGEANISSAVDLLRSYHVPSYPFPEHAVKSFSVMTRYSAWRKQEPPTYERFEVDRERVALILEHARERGQADLGERETRDIIGGYGFRLPRTLLAQTSVDAVAAAEGIGYPVAMKISSPTILHKTDIGGVLLNLRNAEEVKHAFQAITARARRTLIWGVLVQEMIQGGREVILGMSRDKSFGPLLMFGLGGIYVEVLKDVAFRVAPVSRKEALRLIREIQTYPLLKGVRGERPADAEAMAEAICRLSQLVTDFENILEMDINPLLVLPEGEGAVAVDARLTVKID
jgi:acetyltransferase